MRESKNSQLGNGTLQIGNGGSLDIRIGTQTALKSIQCRKWEIEHKQRLSIFEKNTGEHCGAFALSLMCEENHGTEEDFKELFRKYENIKNLYTPYIVFESTMKKDYKEYFQDLTKVSIMHAFAVPAQHRGKKLAQLMCRVSIQQSIKWGCKYLFAHMVSPQTQHIAKKTGLKVKQQMEQCSTRGYHIQCLGGTRILTIRALEALLSRFITTY